MAPGQLPVAGGVAAVAGVAFASSAAAFTWAIHPACLEAGPRVHTIFFDKVFNKIARMQATFVLVGVAAAATQAARSAAGPDRSIWASASMLLATILPWTSGQLMPVNRAIMGAAKRGEDAKAVELKAWGPLHNVRTATSIAASAIMLYALYRQAS